MKILMLRTSIICLIILALSNRTWVIGSEPTRSKQGMVVSQDRIASEVGVQAMRDGGNAIDASIATAFALAVTHPAAGNIGGGGFLVFRPNQGESTAYDFREMAPAAATPDMWLDGGHYDSKRHHHSHLAVGVPGTVAGLYLAWEEKANLPWKRLVQPAIELAKNGFVVEDGLARSLKETLPRFKSYPASFNKFSNDRKPYEAGMTFKQPDLAQTLSRIANRGPKGFYEGETARLIVDDMQANGGIMTLDDLRNYIPKKRVPIFGSYRGYEVISMSPPSSGGIAIVEMLNLLEPFDLREYGYGSSRNTHLLAEVMRRAFADRARYVGDPDFNPQLPVDRLISKEYANQIRRAINTDKASRSSPTSFEWPFESSETTHLSVVDSDRNAVALTYTLEYSYGSGIVVPGGGFLLNNEMGDFNPGRGLTDDQGLIGTEPNLTQPGKRMLSSMTPTILAKDGKVFMVTGTPGGRTIINTVLQTIVNVVDYEMNAQQAVDAGRIHHQWLPNRIQHEQYALSYDVKKRLQRMGHSLYPIGIQGAAQVIVFNQQEDVLEAGNDRRRTGGAAAGY